MVAPQGNHRSELPVTDRDPDLCPFRIRKGPNEEHCFGLLQVAVMDSDGKILPAGQSGELCVRGTGTYRTYTYTLKSIM